MVKGFIDTYRDSATSLKLHSGMLVEGTVKYTKKEHVRINLGMKVAMPFNSKEFKKDTKLSKGSKQALSLDNLNVTEDMYSFNVTRSMNILRQPLIEEALEARTFKNGLVLNQVSGGYSVALGGGIAFLPFNQTLPVNDVHNFVGSIKTFYIMHINKGRNNIIVSRKIALDRWRQLQEHSFT